MHQIARGRLNRVERKSVQKSSAPSLKTHLLQKKNLNQGGALGAHCLCNMHTKEKICATHFTSIEGTVLDKHL